jgi:ATP-dependent Clp protease protease subunit
MKRVVYLFGPVEPSMGQAVIKQLQSLDADGNDPILLKIASPGGCCRTMLAIRDQMRRCKSPIATLAVGLAMSAGFFLMAAGEPGMRSATPNAHLMIHGPNGSSPLTDEDLASMKYYWEVAVEMLAKDSGQQEIVLEEYLAQDQYMFADEALEMNFIDKIVL